MFKSNRLAKSLIAALIQKLKFVFNAHLIPLILINDYFDLHTSLCLLYHVLIVYLTYDLGFWSFNEIKNKCFWSIHVPELDHVCIKRTQWKEKV